ncbi:MAG: hypothetical protein NUW23_15990, partial [Firmicutes bacterium]|nr:hypothetical protein [Bacillota bacterium]
RTGRDPGTGGRVEEFYLCAHAVGQDGMAVEALRPRLVEQRAELLTSLPDATSQPHADRTTTSAGLAVTVARLTRVADVRARRSPSPPAL